MSVELELWLIGIFLGAHFVALFAMLSHAAYTRRKQHAHKQR